ncbi:MAG: hypothetical protein ACREMH_01725 [Gemmatimonadales bacterium]
MVGTAIALMLVLTTTGCSYIFTHGPPDNHAQLDSFTCTEGNTAPTLDLAAAGLQLANLLVIASDPDEYESDTGWSSTAGIGVNLGWLALFGASAVAGFNKSKACRAARKQLAERLARLRDTTATAAVPEP